MFDWVVRYYIGDMFHSRTVSAKTAMHAWNKVRAVTPKDVHGMMRKENVELADR